MSSRICTLLQLSHSLCLVPCITQGALFIGHNRTIADCLSCAGTVSNAADPLAGGSDLAPAGLAPNSPDEGTQRPQASFSQRVTRNVQRALSHNGGQTPARHPAQFPASTSPAVLQGLANAGPSSQPGSR